MPNRDDYLTLEDVDDLPNGFATVLRVWNPIKSFSRKARVDDDGFVRTLSDELVPTTWTVEPDPSVPTE